MISISLTFITIKLVSVNLNILFSRPATVFDEHVTNFNHNYVATHTGLNILFSGPATVLIVSYEAYHVLIPALVETLTPVQTLYPYPPDPQVYEGAYNGSGGVEALIEGKPEFNITTYQNQLLMSGPFNAFLAYREPLNLQVVTFTVWYI